MATLLSLGSINADFQVRTRVDLDSAETLLADDFQRRPGGKAANTAYLAARFGHRSLLLGRVGDDELAEQALVPLRHAGVDLTGVTPAEGTATAVSMILVPPSGKKRIVLANNANDRWDAEARQGLDECLAAAPADALLVLDCEIPTEIVRQAIEAAAARGLIVVVDPSFPERLPAELAQRITALTPNEEEAAGLLGEGLDDLPSLGRAARRLQQRGTPLVCIKLADGGCVLAEGERLWHLPPEPVDPVDSTGAGDAFTGVFAIGLSEGRSPREAATWATAAASLAVTGAGSQEAYAGRAEVLALAECLAGRWQALEVAG
ncbi:carbohydrate kinase family protein [Pseudomonas oryzihabitans]|uniref:carbohydrate kinase family protein n=1 Tax=Pseudomonas oryzihabitans TaxID=47885 RepID=UPI00285B0E38|nr:PfkB family carbohydrate kinase [Pseudomonas psychrotolerans]MDR6680319.1 ribokinase [Pseudomonas psychrotolerans]